MKILIDLQSGQTVSRIGGIGRYSIALAKSMISLGREHDFHILLSSLFPDTITSIQEEFSKLIPINKIKIINLLGPLTYAHGGYPNGKINYKIASILRESFILHLNPDILHVTSHFEGLYSDAVTTCDNLNFKYQKAVTLYDLIPLVEKKIYLKEKYQLDWYLEKINHLKNYSLFLAISEFSKKEAINLLNISSDNIFNIGAAVDSRFRPSKIPENISSEIKKKFRIKGRFLLFSGSFDKRKNHQSLIRAYATLPFEIRQSHQLVIAGNYSELDCSNLFNLAKKNGLNEDELILTGYISDSDLIILYNLCALFVFPSLREGFGLTILEAMSCGAPVIGSDTTSISEVINKRDALFDPYNVKDIANKIYQALSNRNFYNELLKNSTVQAKKFSWDKSASIALDALEKNFELKNKKNYKNFYTTKSLDYLNTSINLLKKIDGICEIDKITFNNLVANLSLNLTELGTKKYVTNSGNKLRVGWVATWNTKCGIAMHCKSLVEEMPTENFILAPRNQPLVETDKKNVLRCWNLNQNEFFTDLIAEIEKNIIDIVVIQFQYGFFDFNVLSNFIKQINKKGIPIFIIFHSTQDPYPKVDKKLLYIQDALNLCDLYAHASQDLKRLNSLGLKKNINFISLNLCDVKNFKKNTSNKNNKFVIATYGFALPNKGLIELIDAFAIIRKKIPDAYLLMVNAEYPISESSHLLKIIKSKVKKMKIENYVILKNKFLKDNESLSYLKNSDLIVIPYQETTESSSGSVRMALQSGKPVAVTPSEIFLDTGQTTIKLPGFTPFEIAEGVIEIYNKIKNYDKSLVILKKSVNLWLNSHQSKNVAEFFYKKIIHKIESMSFYDS